MIDFRPLLEPISRHVVTLDLSDTAAAEQSLEEHFPFDGEHVQGIVAGAVLAAQQGTICDRGEPGMRFSRVVKPKDDVAGCSIDAVYMDSSEGPAHGHPKGEVCLCISESEEATFEGRRAHWLVLPPGSHHRPRVENGAMLILYWLPEGAVAWGDPT